MSLFYFRCEKCDQFQELEDDTPTPESVPHIEYQEEYSNNETTIMVPICKKCYSKFKKEWAI